MAGDQIRRCPAAKKCGGCSYSGISYKEQLKKKQQAADELFSELCPVEPVLGMKEPCYYRSKVHHVFARTRGGEIISGSYMRGTHVVVNLDDCLLEDRKSQEIMFTIRRLAKSFKYRIYDEDSESGLLRHVLIRRGYFTGEIMVVLVLTSSILPGKNNFIKALREEHPEITTIVINVNDRDTNMILGDYSKTIYGPGFIREELCGCTFRISPASFCQVNPVQTEVLYRTAADFAGLTGTETVIDAYCGIGTIGLSMAKRAGTVIGVELNEDAVRDAVQNARDNDAENVRFVCGDAGEFMEEMAREGEHAHVVIMDPPRSGSTEKFIRSAVRLKPDRIVYVSCGPDTLRRDLELFALKGYRTVKLQPVDMFPFTEHCEMVALLVPGEKPEVRPRVQRTGDRPRVQKPAGGERRSYGGERKTAQSGERRSSSNGERNNYHGNRGSKQADSRRDGGYRSGRRNNREA